MAQAQFWQSFRPDMNRQGPYTPLVHVWNEIRPEHGWTGVSTGSVGPKSVTRKWYAHVMPCHANPAMPCHVLPFQATPVMPFHAMPCHAMPRHATLPPPRICFSAVRALVNVNMPSGQSSRTSPPGLGEGARPPKPTRATMANPFQKKALMYWEARPSWPKRTPKPRVTRPNWPT